MKQILCHLRPKKDLSGHLVPRLPSASFPPPHLCQAAIQALQRRQWWRLLVTSAPLRCPLCLQHVLYAPGSSPRSTRFLQSGPLGP